MGDQRLEAIVSFIQIVRYLALILLGVPASHNNTIAYLYIISQLILEIDY